MIVLMNACKEEKNGNFLSVERRMIAGTVAVILELEIKALAWVKTSQQLFPKR